MNGKYFPSCTTVGDFRCGDRQQLVPGPGERLTLKFSHDMILLCRALNGHSHWSQAVLTDGCIMDEHLFRWSQEDGSKKENRAQDLLSPDIDESSSVTTYRYWRLGLHQY